jgi:hypothetical protein
MADKPVRTFGPLALTTTLTTNVYAGAGGSALIYDLIRTLWIENKTAAPATVTLYLGATGANTAGTELMLGVSIPANTAVPFYFSPGLRMDSTDFLVGGSNTTLALTITGMGVQAVK